MKVPRLAASSLAWIAMGVAARLGSAFAADDGATPIACKRAHRSALSNGGDPAAARQCVALCTPHAASPAFAERLVECQRIADAPRPAAVSAKAAPAPETPRLHLRPPPRCSPVLLAEKKIPEGFACVAAGDFEMGSPAGEVGRYDDERQHPVTLTRHFAIQVAEVTQREWREVMGTSPSFFGGCDDCPVERVSWFDSLVFANKKSKGEECYELAECSDGQPGGGCDKDEPGCMGSFRCLRVKLRLSCKGFRLPSEAEWEYAARAGVLDATYADPGIESIAIFGTTRPSAVRSRRPNALGLADVLGNVFEWTADSYAAYPAERATDPLPNQAGAVRVIRGGSWDSPARYLRFAYRARAVPASRNHLVGLRLARSIN